MKKAFDQLESLGLAYDFHDYKTQGIDRATLQQWVDQLGVERLLNKRGTTWRKMTPGQQADILASEHATLQALADYPSLIKRPVLVNGQQILVGFDAASYQALNG